jgi:hypothetical protein
MKVTGFLFTPDSIGLESNGNYFDLHNNFDFVGISYLVMKREIVLSWDRNDGSWVQKGLPRKLTLKFDGVTLFKAKQRDPEMPFTEDDCVNTMGFIWDDMVEEMGGSGSNEPKASCTHLVMDFMSGFAIKISADSVSLSQED